MKIPKTSEIRIIAPSSSWRKDRANAYIKATKRLESMGFKVTFGKNFKADDLLGSASVEKRVSDLHEAYEDKNVTAIMALNGGWLANSILPSINWDLISKNPKPMIGYSDITILVNAIYAKTGNIGYLGPNLGTFGYSREVEYTKEYLVRILTETKPIRLAPSKEWGVGNKRRSYKTGEWTIIQPGKAEGVILGGNLGTFYLLQGTECMPKFKEDTILIIEDDDEAGDYTTMEFDRRLESLLQQPDVRKRVSGIMVGRFQPTSKVNLIDLSKIFKAKYLHSIPIIAGVDFGHTVPMLTLPIGGKLKLTVDAKISAEILEY